MQHRAQILIIVGGVFAIFAACMVFFSIPMNTAWIVISMFPVAIVVGLLLQFAESNAHRRYDDRQRQFSAGGQFQRTWSIEDGQVAREAERTEYSESLDGVWHGTIGIRRHRQLNLVPIRVALRGTPIRCRMLPVDHTYNGDRVIGFDVVDRHAERGPVQVRVDVLAENGSERIAHETFVDGGVHRLASTDQTESVVVELRRQR